MKIVSMGSTATLCTATKSVRSGVEAFDKAPNNTPPIHSVSAESFRLS